jgi:predicted transposase/invertase (TIGR01784 family)
LKARYINPYTDFGFKKLFGEEGSKDLLVDFLNQLLPAKHKIVNLSFKPPEQLNEIASDRKAIFDIFCMNENGERFIVEMQKAKLKFFKDRAVFYTTFPIREQADKGEWNFQLNPVYCVAILDFIFEDEREQKSHISHVELKDQYCQTFYDKLTYIFIEMPRFKKEEHQLENHFDKWLYFLKNLEDFETIPGILNEDVFVKAFEIAKIANFDKQQLDQYEKSLKIYRDLKGVIDTSFEDGESKGKAEGIEIGKEIGQKNNSLNIAAIIKKAGEPIEKIIAYTGLSAEEIDKL